MSSDDSWLDREIVWLALEGAGDAFREVLHEYTTVWGEMVPRSIMREIIDVTWARTGKQPARQARIDRRAVWDAVYAHKP